MKVVEPRYVFDNKNVGSDCKSCQQTPGQLAIRAVAAGVVPTVAEIGAWRATDDAENVRPRAAERFPQHLPADKS